MQVLADTGKVGHDVDPERAQVLCRPDAREQEELRRADGSAADDDLRRAGALDAAVLRPLDADAPGAVEQQPSRASRPVTMLEVGVVLDGRMYAAAVLWRMPSSMLYCMNDTPSCDAPL